MQLYMSTDSNDDVILAGNPTNALFRLRDVEDTTNVTTLTTLPEYFSEWEEVSEKNYTGSFEIEEDSFHGKIIVSEKISISEE